MLTKFCCIAYGSGLWLYSCESLVSDQIGCPHQADLCKFSKLFLHLFVGTSSQVGKGHFCIHHRQNIHIESPGACADSADFARFLHRRTDNFHHQA